jgi:O-acetyl-ADP-ribose deacetylase (regulator of RNase III)
MMKRPSGSSLSRKRNEVADKRMDVKTIAVIGAGSTGREIAYAAVLGGYATILEDVSHGALDQAITWIKQTLDQAVTCGKGAANIRDAALENLLTASTVEDAIRDADLIIEALPEEIEMKIELFTIFDKFARPNAIFASNATSLSITEIAAVTFCADRCIGMRFFDPVPENNMLELVKGSETSEETIAICSEVGRRMGKEVVVVHESGPVAPAIQSGNLPMPRTNPGENQMNKQLPKELAQKIVIRQGDLTEMETDAIVNAANNDLILGAGVAGAIRRKGGAEIQRECGAIGSIPVGYAAITTGGNLAAKYVIHAASMQLGGTTTAEALRRSTAHALRIAAESGLKTIAFPAVGTGIAGFPMKECAEIMLHEAALHLQSGTSLETIYFVLFDEAACEAFKKALKRLRTESTGAARAPGA